MWVAWPCDLPLPGEGEGYLSPSCWAHTSSRDLFWPMKWTKVTGKTFMWKVYMPALGHQPTLSVFPSFVSPRMSSLWAAPSLYSQEWGQSRANVRLPPGDQRSHERNTFLRFLESFVITAWLGLSSLKWKSFSRVQLFVTTWSVAHQIPLSVEFSRPECWSR